MNANGTNKGYTNQIYSNYDNLFGEREPLPEYNGMTKEELEKNLGTIARSGSLDFKTENQSDNIDIIGQFGVGFYSAFMVAKKVTVISRAQGADTAWKWESTGVEGYTLTEADKEDVGTEIILVRKDDTDTDK